MKPGVWRMITRILLILLVMDVLVCIQTGADAANQTANTDKEVQTRNNKNVKAIKNKGVKVSKIKDAKAAKEKEVKASKHNEVKTSKHREIKTSKNNEVEKVMKLPRHQPRLPHQVTSTEERPLPQDVTIMTFNVNWGDSQEWDSRSWVKRRKLTADVIIRQNPTVIGLQQPTNEQMRDIMRSLGDGYAWFPKRPTTNKLIGELGAMIYNSRQVALTARGSFWLSEKPDVPWSQFPEATEPRLVTWGRFQRMDRPPTGDERHVFYVFNVHLESFEDKARQRQAELILKKIPEVVKPVSIKVEGIFRGNARPMVFLVGDFSSRRGGHAWKLFTGKLTMSNTRGINGITRFLDAWQNTKTRKNPVRDTVHDYRGFKVYDPSGSNHRDFVLYQPPAMILPGPQGNIVYKEPVEPVKVVDAAIVVDSDKRGYLYPSDHYPVVARF